MSNLLCVFLDTFSNESNPVRNVKISDARWRNSPPNNSKLADFSHHLAVTNVAAPPSGKEKKLAVKAKIWRNWEIFHKICLIFIYFSKYRVKTNILPTFFSIETLFPSNFPHLFRSTIYKCVLFNIAFNLTHVLFDYVIQRLFC